MTARAGKVSLHRAQAWLTEIQNGTIPTYMALYTSDPHAVVNPTSVELSAVSSVYSRQVATWTLSGRILTLANVLLWLAIPAGVNITHIGAMSVPSGGDANTFEFAGPVPVSAAAPNGYYAFTTAGALQIAAGAYHVGLDS